MRGFFLILGGLIFSIPCLRAQDPTAGKVNLQLPTANDNLFTGHPEKFFQPTISGRPFSGMYGFVRSTEPEPPKLFNKFHEGIDIQPMVVTPTVSPRTWSMRR